MTDLLKPLKHVIDHAEDVKIDLDAIDQYVASFQLTQLDHWLKACPFVYHPLPSLKDEIARWFLSDSMAFCFWGYPAKWTINYQGKLIDGWWALLASFQRALEEGIPLLDATYLSSITQKDLSLILRGKPEIPLFTSRLQALKEIGLILSKNYSGHFSNYFLQAPRDAVSLSFDLAKTFPIFDDVSPYQGKMIPFYKKSQLLVHDLLMLTQGSPYPKIVNTKELTGEADYKIPALLRHFGILRYSDSLAKQVDHRVELLPDSHEEVEIRASMLWACQLICERLRERHIDLDPVNLDGILWVQSQSIQLEKPYHLTLTTDY